MDEDVVQRGVLGRPATLSTRPAYPIAAHVAVVHDRHALAQRIGLFHQVRGQENGRAVVVAQLL